jgi:hypothetical protein
VSGIIIVASHSRRGIRKCCHSFCSSVSRKSSKRSQPLHSAAAMTDAPDLENFADASTQHSLCSTRGLADLRNPCSAGTFGPGAAMVDYEPPDAPGRGSGKRNRPKWAISLRFWLRFAGIRWLTNRPSALVDPPMKPTPCVNCRKITPLGYPTGRKNPTPYFSLKRTGHKNPSPKNFPGPKYSSRLEKRLLLLFSSKSFTNFDPPQS